MHLGCSLVTFQVLLLFCDLGTQATSHRVTGPAPLYTSLLRRMEGSSSERSSESTTSKSKSNSESSESPVLMDVHRQVGTSRLHVNPLYKTSSEDAFDPQDYEPPSEIPRDHSLRLRTSSLRSSIRSSRWGRSFSGTSGRSGSIVSSKITTVPPSDLTGGSIVYSAPGGTREDEKTAR